MEVNNPDLFVDVVPGWDIRYDCSPQMDWGVSEIKINAPKTVTYRPGNKNHSGVPLERLMLCGAYQFKTGFLVQIGRFRKLATVVAVNTRSHEPFTTKIEEYGEEVRIYELPNFPPEKLESPRIGYFNENILEFLKLPDEPATYHIFVTLQQYTSNVVTVTLKSPD